MERALPLMETFYSIQGEGYHQGKAAYFIRLAGCDVGCHWCDVKESWDASKHRIIPVEDIVEQAIRYSSELVVITGGEPLMYNLEYLTRSLKFRGKNCHLETSGAHPISGNWDWICLSPKKFKAPVPESCQVANELKVIIYHHSDFKWAELYREKVGNDCKLFLQPEWDRADKMLPLIIDYVKKYPEWEISLQTHKFMKIP